MTKTMDSGVVEFDEFAPVAESGEMWKPRTEEEARKSMRNWPACGEWATGERWDGIYKIVKRHVRIEYGEWTDA